jgi:dTDP-4-dehydrorhamnose reductase
LNWVITGSAGQLGRALRAHLEARGGERCLAAPDRAGLDVGDREAVRRLLRGLGPAPDVVVNAAAFTHVDRCEAEPGTAGRVNAEGPGHLAEACREAGALLVHVSTDYVFGGDSARPYREEDPPDPRSAYGRSKLEGERRVLAAAHGSLVVRTSWVFGQGRNFIAAILAQLAARRRGEIRGPLRVVDDQHGRPTYAVDLAAAIVQLVERGARGLYHVANQGVASWWDLARFCLDEAGAAQLEIERIKTADLSLPAPRPAYSVLDCGKAERLGVALRPWRGAVRDYLRSEGSPLAGLPPESRA